MLRRLSLNLKIWVGYGTILTILLTLGVVSVTSMWRAGAVSRKLSDGYVPELRLAGELERSILMTNWYARSWAITASPEDEKAVFENLSKVEPGILNLAQLVKNVDFLVALREGVPKLEAALKIYKSTLEATREVLKEVAATRENMNRAAKMADDEIHAVKAVTERVLDGGAKAEAGGAAAKRYKLVIELIETIDEIRIANFKAQSLRNMDDLEAVLKEFGAATEMLKGLLALSPDAVMEKKIKEFQGNIGDYEKAIAAFLELQKKSAAISKERLGAAMALQAVVKEVTEKGAKGAQDGSESTSLLLASAQAAMVLGIAIAFLVAVILGAIIIRAINAPIQEVTRSLREAGIEVNSASGQLSTASQKLSASSTQSAASLEQTASSIEEFTTMVAQNSEHAREVNSLAVTARDTAEKGEEEIRGLIKAMDDIVVGSRKIEEISAVIDGIAFQTNLLALNAAVEAARAGEHGKGFAVVAEAVRNLAQKSATSAKEISSIISESVSKSDNGARIATQAGETLKNIVINSKKVSDLIAEIASATHEQTQGMSQISKAIAQIDQVTQSNAATAEQSAAASEELSAQAATLQESVERLAAVVQGEGRTP